MELSLELTPKLSQELPLKLSPKLSLELSLKLSQVLSLKLSLELSQQQQWHQQQVSHEFSNRCFRHRVLHTCHRVKRTEIMVKSANQRGRRTSEKSVKTIFRKI